MALPKVGAVCGWMEERRGGAEVAARVEGVRDLCPSEDDKFYLRKQPETIAVEAEPLGGRARVQQIKAGQSSPLSSKTTGQKWGWEKRQEKSSPAITSQEG